MSRKDREPERSAGLGGLPKIGRSLTRGEILGVLVDEGYSADQRKDWLKEVLTALEQRQADGSAEHEDLVREVKTIIDNFQSGKPIADDLL